MLVTLVTLLSAAGSLMSPLSGELSESIFAPMAVMIQAVMPSLGAADSSVLGDSAVTNTDNTVITGDLGVSPGTATSGFPPGLVGGTTHLDSGIAQQAQSDLIDAYHAR